MSHDTFTTSTMATKAGLAKAAAMSTTVTPYSSSTSAPDPSAYNTGRIFLTQLGAAIVVMAIAIAIYWTHKWCLQRRELTTKQNHRQLGHSHRQHNVGDDTGNLVRQGRDAQLKRASSRRPRLEDGREGRLSVLPRALRMPSPPRPAQLTRSTTSGSSSSRPHTPLPTVWPHPGEKPYWQGRPATPPKDYFPKDAAHNAQKHREAGKPKQDTRRDHGGQEPPSADDSDQDYDDEQDVEFIITPCEDGQLQITPSPRASPKSSPKQRSPKTPPCSAKKDSLPHVSARQTPMPPTERRPSSSSVTTSRTAQKGRRKVTFEDNTHGEQAPPREIVRSSPKTSPKMTTTQPSEPLTSRPHTSANRSTARKGKASPARMENPDPKTNFI